MVRSIARVLAVEEPEGEPAPVVFDSPHSGTDYPDDFGSAAPWEVLQTGVDLYVEELFSDVTRHGAVLLHALYPRTYIDPNRALDDIDEALLAAPWPGPVNPTRKCEQGMGLVRRLAVADVPMYDRRLTVEEVQRRIDTCYLPYHHALEALLDRGHARHGGVWHIDCHSMKAVGTPMNDDAGQERPDMVLGDRDGTTCDPAFMALVRETLTGMGYTVRVNDPYKGVELVRRYADPAANRHSLQVEINRKLYMDESTFDRTGGFDVLRRDLRRLAGRVCDFAAERVRNAKGAAASAAPAR